MDSTEVVPICPYCQGNPEYLADASECARCGTKRPQRSVYVKWEGGSAESRRLEQRVLDLAIHGDNFTGWIRSVIVVDGPIRRISDIELHDVAGLVADERRARDLISLALGRVGLLVE